MTSREAYARREDGTYDPQCITKLLRNYRSHSAILQLPNDMFYDGELVAVADPVRTDNMLRGHWEHLKNPTFPIMFHGVVGKDEREESSPSWFNTDEANEVLGYVQHLVRDRPYVQQRDIGVITPYAKQAAKLRLLLRANLLQEVMVGSTELFQGQEKRVIIISCVRSTKEWLPSDARHNLGFLANPKRFNVAITRAIALLIVVGNPYVLREDHHWGALLRYAIDNSAYVGEQLPPGDFAGGGADAATVSELEEALENMRMQQAAVPDVNDEFEFEGPAWSNMED